MQAGQCLRFPFLTAQEAEVAELVSINMPHLTKMIEQDTEEVNAARVKCNELIHPVENIAGFKTQQKGVLRGRLAKSDHPRCCFWRCGCKAH